VTTVTGIVRAFEQVVATLLQLLAFGNALFGLLHESFGPLQQSEM
jgi:hypothetical protein